MGKYKLDLNNEGFSIIELITVIALIGIVGSIALSLFDVGTSGYFESNTRNLSMSEAVLSSQLITNEIRRNDEISKIDVKSFSGYPEVLEIIRETDTLWIYYDPTIKEVMYRLGSSFTTETPVAFTSGGYIEALAFGEVEELGVIKQLNLKIDYNAGGTTESLASKVYIRSGH